MDLYIFLSIYYLDLEQYIITNQWASKKHPQYSWENVKWIVSEFQFYRKTNAN